MLSRGYGPQNLPRGQSAATTHPIACHAVSSGVCPRSVQSSEMRFCDSKTGFESNVKTWASWRCMLNQSANDKTLDYSDEIGSGAAGKVKQMKRVSWASVQEIERLAHFCESRTHSPDRRSVVDQQSSP